ncbi:CehA/McbA family metallohydrolase [Halomarina litorea]|uniref:CehA/McbA family metallohydrolase n=1 Tax=Halomarina litorea TaxID=2961595 RepID=UPI0020C32BF1|nr:PHP domain-containing protein [Halomarina sp. BCD28]
MARTVSVDMHVHSEGSYDAGDPVELLLEQAADIGLDAIVVTDHDSITESLRAARIAPEYDLVGIPGVEVSTAQGHLLAVGVEERPASYQPLDETVERVRDLGGAAVVPHPFQRTRHGVRKRHIGDCDAVEVYNSWLFTGYRNRRARTFARARGYPDVAASDAHDAAFIGRAYTDIELDTDLSNGELTSEHVVRAIKNGSTRIHGRRKPIPRSAKHYLWAAQRRTGRAVASTAASVVGSVSNLR